MRTMRIALLTAFGALGGCVGTPSSPEPEPDVVEAREGIIVAGERLPVAARVITFEDPGGFDGRLERCRFLPDRVLPTAPAPGCDTPRRFRARPADGLDVHGRVEEGGWTRETLRQRVSQVIFHYDACGTSFRCFEVLHDVRGLSCHFLVDLDGTVYQTLDLSARARHAGVCNDASIGIEIAHVGAYPPGDPTLGDWYREGPDGLVITMPPSFHPPAGRHVPSRPGMFEESINGRVVAMPDYTEAQYLALASLVDALVAEFPRLRRRTPRDAAGAPLRHVLPVAERTLYEGFLGHHHVSEHKSDPGPAFDWRRVVRERE